MNTGNFRALAFAVVILLTTTSTSFGQGIACGPTLGYESAEGDHITLLGATCVFMELMGPVALRPHLAYGFGAYDWGDGYDGTYSGIRFGAEVFYPFSVSDTSPVVVYPFAGPGILSWWEDCDFDDCSDTETFLDVGAGAQFNQFGLELFIIVGSEDISMDLGARVHALFDI